MEIIAICVAISGLLTVVAALDEHHNWLKSYEDAAREQREENERHSRRNSIAKS